MVIFTIGHSTHPLDAFIGLLTENSVQQLIDVRTIPRSRHNPQFNADSLPKSLHQAGIRYAHLGELGGLRKTRKDSPNIGWRNVSFRGYADYMLTPGFENGLSELVAVANEDSVAIMCAETVPWRCHRSLIADALTVRGIEVRHIMGPGKWQLHKLTPFAQVDGTHITYPFALESGS
ncbi:MAG: DUF488 family protein [Gammaproteobacteria bacterium]